MFHRAIAVWAILALAATNSWPANPQAPVGASHCCLSASAAEFETVAIHPEESSGASHFVKMGFEGNGYIARGATLSLLLQSAFGIHDDKQIIGLPKWARSESFSIEARFDSRLVPCLSSMDAGQVLLIHQHMLQKLLMDRFDLASHVELKTMPILSLTVLDGRKLHKAVPNDSYEKGVKWPSGVPVGPHFVNYAFGSGHVKLTGQGASVDQLVSRLTEKAYWLGLDKILVDKTDLDGRYDFNLDFTVPWPPGSSAVAETDGAPDMVTALRDQLGLKLKEEKGSVDVLVLDHIDPASNN